MERSSNDLMSAILAEYSALRSEIGGRISAQDGMINIYMTAVAAIIGFALSDRSRLLLLLIVPVLSFSVRLLYQAHNGHIGLIARYVNGELRQLAADGTGESRVLGWEDWNHGKRTWRDDLPHGLGLVVLFPLSAVLSMLLVVPALDAWWNWTAWVFDALLLIGQIFLIRLLKKPIETEGTSG
jgi:hypothetical protein